MATVTGLKEIPASTTIKADSLYIDKKAMNVVKANLKNDMTKANDLWLNLYTITQRSVSHGVFAGQTKTTLSKLAKSAHFIVNATFFGITSFLYLNDK